MKTIYKYSIVLLAALLCAPFIAFADEDTDPSVTKGNGVVLKKTVRDATTDEKGEYILTLEAYATGTSATVITDETVVMPCDIVLVLDESGSMRANWFVQYAKGTSVNASNLQANKVYKVIVDGKEYYMKGFYSTENYTKITNKYSIGNGVGFDDVCSVANSSIPSAYTKNSAEGWTSEQQYPHYNASSIPVTLTNEYYVLYNSKYYQIEPYFYWWGTKPGYNLVINLGSEKKYLNGANIEGGRAKNNNNEKYTDFSTNIWTGDIYTKTGSGTITYVYSETIPTNVNDGTVINPSSATSIFSTTTQFVTREQTTKEAAKEFVQTVKANNPEDNYHNLAIRWYSGDGQGGWLKPAGSTDNLVGLSSATVVSNFQTAIDGVAPSGTGTKVDQGMENAYNLLIEVKDDEDHKNRNKVVVLFTDGEPGTASQTFEAPVARTAVTYANQLKNMGAQVFSIGFLDKEQSDKHINTANGSNQGVKSYDIRRFLHYVSSNYNIGTSINTYNFDSNFTGAKCLVTDYSGDEGGDEAPHDYYIYSDGSNLSSIFQAVASQASSGTTSGGAGKELTAETTTVLDIISQEFRLPPELIAVGSEVDVEEYIKVHTEHLNTSTSTADNYVWVRDETTDASPTIAFSKEDEDESGNDIVRVNGFDFTQDDVYNASHTVITSYGHWVGGRTIGSTTTYAGSKLVIEIPIIKADNYNGGFNTPTNTSSSALVYVNPSTGKEETVLAFAIPDLDFPSLAVAKSGLEPGESAIFTVKQLTGWNADGTDLVEVENGISYTVIVTNDDTKIERKIVENDINGSPSKNVDGTEYWYEIIKDIPEGEYLVTETAWSWTYTTTIPTHKSYTTVGTNAIKQLVTKKQITDNHDDGNGEFKAWGDDITKKIIIFEFNNSKKESNPAHGEDSKKNVFIGVGVEGGSTSDDDI